MPHGADREPGGLVIRKHRPHGAGGNLRREEPARRVGDTEVGENGGSDLLRVVGAEGPLRLMGDRAEAAMKTPDARRALRGVDDAGMPLELGRYRGLAMGLEVGGGGHGHDRHLRDLAGNQTGVGQFAIVDVEIDALLH